ncbi:MAG: hypothetical protein CMQ40_03960 [Gammaproteobacteria bacterium]|nr:hypothetical protein [Gammaproteobacteria bacterium]
MNKPEKQEKRETLLEKVPDLATPRCSLDMCITMDNDRKIEDSVMRLQTFSGTEEISQPFTYNLECAANDYVSGGLPHDKHQSRDQELELESTNSSPWWKTSNPLAHSLNTGRSGSEGSGTKMDSPGKNTPPQRDLSFLFDEIIGSNVSVRIGLPETGKDVSSGSYPGDNLQAGGWPKPCLVGSSERPVSFFNGIVTSFAMAERGKYHLEVKPSIFRLGLQSHYRIFEDKTIKEVIETVLALNNIRHKTHALGLANYRKQDWIQTGETDLDFISGLMKKVNLFYYFEHSDKDHRMIITDQPFYQPIYERKINRSGFSEETEKVKSLLLSYTEGGQDREDYISDFKYQENLTTQGVSTMLAQQHSTWEEANTSEVEYHHNDDYEKPTLNMEQMHVVQYGATDYEADKRSDTANKKISAGKASLDGKSACAELKPGYYFNVEESFRDDASDKTPFKGLGTPVRPEINNKEFVAISVSHTASVDGSYSNHFSAVDKKFLATKFESGGDHKGNILAIVVKVPGPSAKQSMKHTQKKYFSKTPVFDYESKSYKYTVENREEGKEDQSYSCRGLYVKFVNAQDSIRSHWVKLASHMTTVPELGSYVLVGKSSDETEVPEIQQTLESKGSKNIMPGGYTVHTSVGDSYNTSYGDSASISMGKNKDTALPVAENIVETARATGKFNSVSFNESDSFSHSRSALTESHSTVGVSESYSTVGTSESHSTVGTSKNDSKVGGIFPNKLIDALNKKVEDSISEEDKDFDDEDSDFVQYSTSRTIGDSFGKSVTFGKTENVSFHGSSRFVAENKEPHESGNSSNLCSTNTSVTYGDTENYSYHYGKSLNASVQAVGISENRSATGSSSSESVVGFSNNSSCVAASTSQSVSGVSVSSSATGSATNISATLESTGISATTYSTNLSATGMSNSFEFVGGGTEMKAGPGRTEGEIRGLRMEILSAIKVII